MLPVAACSPDVPEAPLAPVELELSPPPQPAIAIARIAASPATNRAMCLGEEELDLGTEAANLSARPAESQATRRGRPSNRLRRSCGSQWWTWERTRRACWWRTWRTAT